MNTLLKLLAFGLITLSVQSNFALSQTPRIGEACPFEETNACINAKIAFLSVQDSTATGKLDPYSMSSTYCQEGDADACWLHGSLLSGDIDPKQVWPEQFYELIRVNAAQAEASYQRSCELGSAMGCATLADFLLSAAGGEIATASVDIQVRVLEADAKACELKQILACLVHNERVADIPVATWPGGEIALYQEAIRTSDIACRAGDYDGCLYQALGQFWIANLGIEPASNRESAVALLQRSCDAGHQPTCAIFDDFFPDGPPTEFE